LLSEWLPTTIILATVATIATRIDITLYGVSVVCVRPSAVPYLHLNIDINPDMGAG
jgi:hypothetical protein